MVPIENCAESPGAIFGSDFMRQALRNQPFQDAIQGHTVKMLTLCANSDLDIVMAESAGRIQQRGQHGQTRRRHPLTQRLQALPGGFADIGGNGGLDHGALINHKESIYAIGLHIQGASDAWFGSLQDANPLLENQADSRYAHQPERIPEDGATFRQTGGTVRLMDFLAQCAINSKTMG